MSMHFFMHKNVTLKLFSFYEFSLLSECDIMNGLKGGAIFQKNESPSKNSNVVLVIVDKSCIQQ